MQDLAEVDGVRDVALFGAGLHLKVDDGPTVSARIRELTDRLGFTDVHVAPISPTMEDVFVSLIEKEDRHHASHR
jgi:ABC-2 type transport system ATP-binding protein